MRTLLISALLVGCASGSKSEPVSTPLNTTSSASAVSTPSSQVKGTLSRKEGLIDLEKRQAELTFKALRCREESEQYVRVQMFLPNPTSPYSTEGIFLQINGNLQTAKEKTKYKPQLLGESPRSEDATRVMAWVPFAELPQEGWVSFEALKKEGPIDVSFSLDFGKKGHVEGRILVEKTEEDVCVVMLPPPG